jgi:hypothetical protein
LAWIEIVVAAGIVGGLTAVAVALQRLKARLARIDSLPGPDDIRAAVVEVAAAASDRTRPLEEAVRRMGESLARLPVPAEAKDLLPLQERLELLARQVQELRLHIDELRARIAGTTSVEPVAPGLKLLRALEERGFESVHILAELAGDEGHELQRVPVEARRAGMSFKGHVTVEDGRLVEVALKPLTELFP